LSRTGEWFRGAPSAASRQTVSGASRYLLLPAPVVDGDIELRPLLLRPV
jgi:hypothetical protein